jgi:hypothetical protein
MDDDEEVTDDLSDSEGMRIWIGFWVVAISLGLVYIYIYGTYHDLP